MDRKGAPEASFTCDWTAKRMTYLIAKKVKDHVGIEPTTLRSAVECSTTELTVRSYIRLFADRHYSRSPLFSQNENLPLAMLLAMTG